MDDDDLDALLDDAVDSAWGSGGGVGNGGGGGGGGSGSGVAGGASGDSDDDMYDEDDDVDLDALLDDALDDSEFEQAAANAVASARLPAPPSNSEEKQQQQKQPPSTSTRPSGKGSLSNNPVGRILEESGLPPAVAAKWASAIAADHTAQSRRGAQRPFSRAYSAWSEKDNDVEEGDGISGSTGDSEAAQAAAQDSAARMGVRMFGESLQLAVRKGHFQSAAVSKSVSAALHGRGADTELVNKLRDLYLDRVLRDTVPRLKSDPDRMSATREGRFPHIQALLRES